MKEKKKQSEFSESEEETMREIAMGFVFGNSYSEGVIYLDGVTRAREIVSASASFNLARYARGRRETGADLINDYAALKKEQYVLEMKGATQAIGEFALRQNADATMGTGDYLRYDSDRALYVFLTLAHLLIPDDHAIITVIPCIPQGIDEEIRKSFRKRISGYHVFKLNGQEKRFRVHTPKLISEGVSSAIRYSVPDKETHGSINIGFFTTDLYVSQGKYDMEYERCESLEVGMHKVGEEMSAHFETLYGRPLKLHEQLAIFKIIHAPSADQERFMLTGTKTVSFQEIRELYMKAIDSVFQQLSEQISARWRIAPRTKLGIDMNQVHCGGGGTYHFFEKLEPLFAEGKLTRTKTPEMDDVLGCAWLANHLVTNGTSGAPKTLKI